SVVQTYQRRRQNLIAGLRASLHCNPTEAGSQPKLLRFDIGLPICVGGQGDTYAKSEKARRRPQAGAILPAHTHSKRTAQSSTDLRRSILLTEAKPRGQKVQKELSGPRDLS